MVRWLGGAALIALAANSSWAWGPAGHKAVARIAEHRLSPAARSAVRELLGDGVALEEVASCADHLRDRAASVPCAGFILPYLGDTTDWHIQGIPLTASVESLDPASYCRKEGDCPSAQIGRQLAILKDADRPKAERQAALAFVVHLVGDIHQPLHCAMDIETGPFRKRFGNTKRVILRGEPVALHHLWDEVLEDASSAARLNRDPGPLVARLERAIGPQPPPSWSDGDVVLAAIDESFKLAKTRIYPETPLGVELGPAYIDKMRPIADERLERAGVRLASLLNSALEKR